MSFSRLTVSTLALLVIAAPRVSGLEEKDENPAWDVTVARGETREIAFDTEEGTWMSVDVSPDGRWLVFDLLAHIYKVAIDGGEAICLTGDSGVAINVHPKFSPDGTTIAFTSDRGGQDNLWLMNADGSQPRVVYEDLKARFYEADWTPDGWFLVARRLEIGDRRAGSKSGLWMLHRDGGAGIELVGNEVPRAAWPSLSPDGRHLFFHASPPVRVASGHLDALKGHRQLFRYDLRSGDHIGLTFGETGQQIRMSSGGAYAPEVSPDGRFVAFARRVADGTVSFKGHRYGPRTALWLRDLEAGSERLLMDPIEVDMAEGMKTLRILPGYSWTPDGKAIVVAQGGRLRRLDIATGATTAVPFKAGVKRTVSEMTRARFRISDEPFRARFLRWHTASPDGSQLAFHAVGRIWTQRLPDGTPERVTSDSFEPFEYAPAWSADGRTLAFTTWSETEGGHLFTVPASGGTPSRLTSRPGEYLHPVWSPDGEEIVVARGSGATERGRTWLANAWFDLVRVPATGGEPAFVARVAPPAGSPFGVLRSQIVRASYGPAGRIFFPEPGVEKQDGRELPITTLVSVRADGSDKREHVVLPWADEIVISPGGDLIAFQEGDNVYAVPIPPSGAGAKPVRVEKRAGKGALPVRQLSQRGGLFPRWQDARTVEYGSGVTYVTYDVDSEESREVEIRLEVPRRIPAESLALTGARIITLDDRSVLEQASLVTRNGRIACVGECDVSSASRVVDVTGKTIIPGLVDMHAHHYREHRGIVPPHNFETAIYLAYGVTTNLDNSMWSQSIFTAAELIEAGESIGPRTFSTGDPLYRGDAARQNELTSYEVTEQNIERLVSWGAVALKQYLQPRRDQRQWVSDVARKKGLMVTSEGSSLAYNLSMVMDGQTAWEHPMSYIPLYSDAAKFFGRAGAVYSPTFMVGGSGAWNEEYFYQRTETWRDDKMRRWLPWRQLIPHTRRRMLRPETDYSFPMIAQGLADIIAEGGGGAIGSHGQHHGVSSHWEVWMAASALGAHGALELASLEGARFLGADRDIGSIEVGKLADLIVLDSNPLEDIERTLDMRYVMKGGVLYDSETLDELWPEERPFGDYYWVDEDALRSDDRAIGGDR